MNESKLETLSLDELDGAVGGGKFGAAVWAGKQLWQGAKWAGNKIGEGIGDGLKALGKIGAAGAGTEAASRGVESATDGKVRMPRPSDLPRK